MTDYTDDSVVLGDGKIRVLGEGGFAELVSGSRVISRTPRGYSPPDREDRLARQQSTVLEIPAGHLWCHGPCGEVRPKEYFDHDASRAARGGYAYVCKACENPVDAARKRHKRREEAAEDGREVRQYNRRQAG